MSTEVAHQEHPYRVLFPGLDIRSRQTLRLALGTTAALAVAYAINWPLSFVSGVLTWAILKHPEPGWGWRESRTPGT